MFDNYGEYEYLFAQIQLVLFMLGMGATLSRHEFTHIFRHPRSLGIGAAGQFVMTPLIAVVINHAMGMPPGIAVGLIMIAAMPGGTLSKLFTYVGRGNIALSISITVLGTLASLVTVPLLLRVLAAEYVPADFMMPTADIVHDLLLYLLLPLAVGMLVSRYAPRRRHIFSKCCISVGFLFVVVMVVGSLASGRIRPAEYGWRVPAAIILFAVLSQQLTMLPFRLMRWPRADCLSVGIEATMRNVNLALLIKALLFRSTQKGIDPIADGALFVILYYAAVAMGAGLPLALNFRRQARREALAKPAA